MERSLSQRGHDEYQYDAREAGLARAFFCLQDYRSGSVITDVIRSCLFSIGG
jgi:hypothetical protein